MLNYLMKDSTSAAFLMLENHLAAGWLSEVRHDRVTKQHTDDILQVVLSGWMMMIHGDGTLAYEKSSFFKLGRNFVQNMPVWSKLF